MYLNLHFCCALDTTNVIIYLSGRRTKVVPLVVPARHLCQSYDIYVIRRGGKARVEKPTILVPIISSKKGEKKVLTYGVQS